MGRKRKLGGRVSGLAKFLRTLNQTEPKPDSDITGVGKSNSPEEASVAGVKHEFDATPKNANSLSTEKDSTSEQLREGKDQSQDVANISGINSSTGLRVDSALSPNSGEGNRGPEIILGVDKESVNQKVQPQNFTGHQLGQTSLRSNDTQDFFKGAKFSSDGTCIVTGSDDNELRLYETYSSDGTYNSSLSPVLTMSEGECIYDYCMYPSFASSDPSTCFLTSVCKDHPVHLWDAYNGSLRASYLPYNDKDELDHTISLSFNVDGLKLLVGGVSCIYTFDVSRPGRQIEFRKTIASRKAKGGQRGLISCFSTNMYWSGMYAAGSYSKQILVYSESDNRRSIAELEGHTGGVTSVRFTPDGNYLLSGSRKENLIYCWDMRMSMAPVVKYERKVETNQRIYFDIDSNGTRLVTGGTDGQTLVYQINSGELLTKLPGQNDAVNGAHFNPRDEDVVVISTGQRHFVDEDSPALTALNSVQLWKIK